MSATVQTAQVGTYRTRERKPLGPVAASLLGALLAASLVAGLVAISSASAGSSVCLPRVGCEPAIESRAGATMAFEPVSPPMEHFLHPAPSIADSSAFEAVSPALEHFLH
jgi:hypothetical protein